jgi:hypothetical protein
VTPSVDDLASAELVHRFGDAFNPPALTNFRGAVQTAVDITAIRSLNFPPFACSDSFPPITWSDSTTAGLFVDGRYFPSTGTPITFRWRPDRVERSAEHEGLRLRSATILAVGKMAALVRLRLTNVSSRRRRPRLRFGLKSTVTFNAWEWTRPIAPAEFDNEAVIDQRRHAILFRARHSPAVSLQGVVPHASGISSNGLDFERELAPGESWELVYVNVIGENGDEAGRIYDEIAAAPGAEFERATESWNAELAAAFTPGNDRYSGSLPRLETSDDDVRRLYHQAVMGVVYFKRELPGPAGGRTYTTLMPRYWQTLTWLWDYQLSSTCHVMLDPAVTRCLLELWMSRDTGSFMATEALTGQGIGEWYAANDHAMIKTIHDYVRWSGDRAWLGAQIQCAGGSQMRVIDRVRSYAKNWENYRSASGLADYGDLRNLLECVRAYAHEVAGLNVANVFGLRVAADMLEALSLAGEAAALRSDAARLLVEVSKLYVDGEGCWAARHPDGRLVPVRHCFDLHTALNLIPDELSGKQREEMVRLLRDELQTPTWMHALSPRDSDAVFDNRPDHQWTGAYPAWPAETVAGLYRIGEVDLAFEWLAGIAKTAGQGPFGQAHFAESVFEPDGGGARKAPSDFPWLTDWACTAGGAWVRVVVESLFGVEATLSEGLRARPQLGRFDRDARLVNLPYQGELYTVDRTGAQRQSGPS